MNHNYFSRPIRTDRNLYGYGHTQLERDPEFSAWGVVKGTAVLLLVFAVAALAAAAVGGS